MPIVQSKTSLAPLSRKKKGESIPLRFNSKTSFSFANTEEFIEQVKSGNKAIRKVYAQSCQVYEGVRLYPHGYAKSLKDFRFATHLTFELRTNFQYEEDMLKKFKNLPYLKSLIIVIKGDWALDVGILKKLGDGLRKLKSLKSLRIKVDQCKTSILKALKRSLRYLKPSSNLTLDFSKSESLDDEALRNLFNDVSIPKRLSNFGLDIANCYNVTAYGLNAVTFFIQSQRGLSGLCLNLLSFRHVEYRGLGHLFETLKQLPKLSYLKLNLSNSGSLSNGSLEILSEALKEFELLSRLTLNMSLCSEVDENALNILLANLSQNKNMRNLSLDFRKCAGLGYPGLNILTSSIQEMKFLSKLALDVSRCEAANDICLKTLQRA